MLVRGRLAPVRAGATAGDEGCSAAPGVVTVDIAVPDCWVAFGDSVRLVGSTPELGSWDPHTGLALGWQEGDSWAARAPLPPGTAAFKLVKLRADGGVEWEAGEDRTLTVPALPEAAAACATLRLECTFGGGPASTRAHLAVDRAAVESLVARTQARVAELTAHRQALAARVAELEAQVEGSTATVQLVKAGAQAVLEEAQAAAGVSAAKLHALDAAAGDEHQALSREEEHGRELAAVDASGGAQAEEAARSHAAVEQTMHSVAPVERDGALLFNFGSWRGPSGAAAAMLAEARLLATLPGEAAAALRRRLHPPPAPRMAVAGGGVRVMAAQVSGYVGGSSSEEEEEEMEIPSALPAAQATEALASASTDAEDVGVGQHLRIHPWEGQRGGRNKERAVERDLALEAEAALEASHSKASASAAPRPRAQASSSAALGPRAQASSAAPRPASGGQRQREEVTAEASLSVFKKGSAPGIAMYLVASIVFSAVNNAWQVGRSSLPPEVQRPADVLFWTAAAGLASLPLW